MTTEKIHTLRLGSTSDGETFVPVSAGQGFIMVGGELSSSQRSVTAKTIGEIKFDDRGLITGITATVYGVEPTKIEPRRIEFAGTMYEVGGPVIGKIVDPSKHRAEMPVLKEAFRPHGAVVKAAVVRHEGQR